MNSNLQQDRNYLRGAITALQSLRDEFSDDLDFPLTVEAMVKVLDLSLHELKRSYDVLNPPVHPLTSELKELVFDLVAEYGYGSLDDPYSPLLVDLALVRGAEKLLQLPAAHLKVVLQELRDLDPLCARLANDLARLVMV